MQCYKQIQSNSSLLRKSKEDNCKIVFLTMCPTDKQKLFLLYILRSLMKPLNRDHKLQKKDYQSLPFKFIRPLIQVYRGANAIQLNFLKKGPKDVNLIEAVLKPLTYIANEQVTKWMVIIVGAQPGYEKAINRAIKIWEFPTLANNWMKEEEIINQYFGKGNTFKKMDKYCVVCLESKHLKYLWCCGLNLCYKCEADIKVKQCPICRHSMLPQTFQFPTIQEVQAKLPNCIVVPDQLNGRSGGTSFEEQEL